MRGERAAPERQGYVRLAVVLGTCWAVTSLIYDASQQMIISGSYDTTVRVWKLKPGVQRTTNTLEGPIRQ